MRRWKENSFRQMRRSRKATLALLAKIAPRDITRPKTQGEWSIKDVIAHFVAWEQLAVQRLKLIRNGKADRVHFFQDIDEANSFNARAVARMKKQTLKQLLERADEIRNQLEKELLRLPESELDNPQHRYPVYKWLPEFAWMHEASHRRRIQNFHRGRRSQD